jgi:hypothetical protein
LNNSLRSDPVSAGQTAVGSDSSGNVPREAEDRHG